jgi:hypothetical protein
MNEYARRTAWYQLGAVAENRRAGILAARGLDTSIPDVAKINDFMPGAGRTAADRDAAASIMKEMPHRALSGSGGIRREKELR